ncbi:MAG: hypothetical protein QM779_06800 [Propionicimonas sp.]|uniref:hypothetical protein n=1 Tax=Propionicimonas sp. TaxID=1955623 RepID=UPI003D108A24
MELLMVLAGLYALAVLPMPFLIFWRLGLVVTELQASNRIARSTNSLLAEQFAGDER